jgi:glutamate dehydrogenase
MDTASLDGAAGAAAFAENLIARAKAGAWPGLKAGGGLAPGAESLLRQLGQAAAAEDLGGLGADDIISLAEQMWSWAASAPKAERVVRVRSAVGADGRPLDRDLLEAIGPDMPFLVDSLIGEVTEQGVSALALFHPILAEAGGARSLIQMHLPPLSKAAKDALVAGVNATFADVAGAVRDFGLMRARMREALEDLQSAKSPVAAAEMQESVSFLEWLLDDKFIFLGCRDYRFPRDAKGEFVQDEPEILSETGLGILRDPERYVLRRGSEPVMNTGHIRRFLEEPTPLIISKSSFASRVHRRAAAEYIGVKHYGSDGEVVGETRFVGLYTAEAFNESTRDIPVLRRKAARVLERAGWPQGSHNARVLQNIVETYPRDELFQIQDDELLATATEILHLLDRPRPRLFVRRDRFNRFITALAYVPKDRFNSTVREAIGNRLVEAYGGVVAAFYPELGDGPLARIRIVVQDIDKALPAPDLAALERDVVAITRTWDDRLEEELRRRADFSDEQRGHIFKRFQKAFGAGYRERFDAAEALVDVAVILGAPDSETVRVRAYRNAADGPDALNCKIYARGAPLPLSSVLPVLENMGLFVEGETPFPVRAAELGQPIWIHDLQMRTRDGRPLAFETVEASFEDAFQAVWNGKADSDGFNRLILKLGISWRDAAMIRALARYRTQTGLDPSQRVQEDALAEYPDLVRQILGLFRVRFDPSLPEGVKEREAWAAEIEKKIDAGLEKVSSLDADRALRRIARLVKGILRTNFYQPGADGQPKSYMSFKIASRELEDLPEPRPYRDIWVWSPEVEGVHLRMGPVARGGLRWSDRRDDFRTEVLDLVKAQQVKNSIIVPVGSKGGFFPKKLPPRDQREAFAAAGQSAYKTFLRGLLDLTDNIVDDKIAPPPQVVRWDGDDPYLVVAADKGTATFSDIANGVSAEYGFWLADAFASGGSVGYDHKAMGITAKGAWEAVKRHFRETGVDIQTTPFTVIGVGDMSGDVFGNGMLLSKQIKLVAAFDHRDIFIDPTPDPARSWVERERLFNKPASSWKDYDPKLISPGGGVFSRNEKSIPLTAEIAALTGLNKSQVTPQELMHALLKAPCDLLWFGGIGAYVKAARESHADVGDKANDSIRVDAEELRAKAIGEGANLGVTQAGRIAFARKGGRINTDAVDNSAGVDTSDHEVNIKILLAEAKRMGLLKGGEREPLLEAMTDDVGRLVLADNYDQTLALTLTQAAAVEDLDAHERLMLRLERAGKLNRKVEGLPGSEEIKARRESREGLTRPELAKLLAYAKIDLYDAIVASAVPEEAYLKGTLKAYFPPQLARFESAMAKHRLRREIIATALADDVINMGGPTFVERCQESARVDAPEIAAAFEAGRAIFGLDALSDRVNALDNKVAAATQTELHQEISRGLRRISTYLARHRAGRPIDALIDAYRDGVQAQAKDALSDLTLAERERAEARMRRYQEGGAPADVARDVAVLSPLVSALDVTDLARKHALAPVAAARLFRQIGAAFHLDRLRGAGWALSLTQHWERLAVRRTLEELFEDQRTLTEHAAKTLKLSGELDAAAAEAAIARWMPLLGAAGAGALASVQDLESAGGWTFSKIVLAATDLRALTNTLGAG